ncbi:MAG: hypothetical protein ACI9TV_001734 [Sulfurimonas sp.]|jgi:hypothetical protein|uniref:hypothetical protein n=1 Tax=Sulfurimonas sp. TaxID=2022749 RepID=UPI0039E6AA54
MNINAKMPTPNINVGNIAKTKIDEAGYKDIQTNFTQKISKEEALEIRAQISENSKAIMFDSTSLQATVVRTNNNSVDMYSQFQGFLQDVGYSGKPIGDLSQNEAAQLVSEDGIFGITQTSERIANFVINGAGGDEDKLRAGRAGMIQGFKEAEAMWGGKLPEISQKTMQASIEMVDKVMMGFGFSLLNQEA